MLTMEVHKYEKMDWPYDYCRIINWSWMEFYEGF